MTAVGEGVAGWERQPVLSHAVRDRGIRAGGERSGSGKQHNRGRGDRRGETAAHCSAPADVALGYSRSIGTSVAAANRNSSAAVKGTVP